MKLSSISLITLVAILGTTTTLASEQVDIYSRFQQPSVYQTLHHETANELRLSAKANRGAARHAMLASQAANNPSARDKWERTSKRHTREAKKLMAMHDNHNQAARVRGVSQQYHHLQSDNRYAKDQYAKAKATVGFAKDAAALYSYSQERTSAFVNK